MNDLPISSILARYDTDKVTGHRYGPTYDELFAAFDRNAPLNILEIGTQKGGSLCAWQDYFPNATVTGVDIVDVVKPEYRRDGIRYVISDIKAWQTDETFDIVIDDGSHFFEDVAYVVETFRPKLRKGGILVIEDVQSTDWIEELPQPFEVRDLRGNYDDILIIYYD